MIPANAGKRSFFLGLLFFLKIEDKGKSRTSSFLDIVFDVVIKYLLKRYLFNNFTSDNKPFSVGSDSICPKLPGDKVDCFKYGAKWNKYLLSIL